MRRAPPQIFDEAGIRRRRERSGSGFANYNFLHERAEQDIVDRLETVTREFPVAIFEGAQFIPHLLTQAAGVQSAIYVDSANSRLPAAVILACDRRSRIAARRQCID